MKAEVFWKYLCEDLNYRFFAGVACPGFNSLYKKMDSKIMHYIPAVDERAALGIVMGAAIVGVKSVVLLDAYYINDLLNTISRLDKYGIACLILLYKSEKIDVAHLSIRSDKDIEKVLKKVSSSNSVSIVTIDEGVIE